MNSRHLVLASYLLVVPSARAAEVKVGTSPHEQAIKRFIQQEFKEKRIEKIRGNVRISVAAMVNPENGSPNPDLLFIHTETNATAPNRVVTVSRVFQQHENGADDSPMLEHVMTMTATTTNSVDKVHRAAIHVDPKTGWELRQVVKGPVVVERLFKDGKLIVGRKVDGSALQEAILQVGGHKYALGPPTSSDHPEVYEIGIDGSRRPSEQLSPEDFTLYVKTTENFYKYLSLPFALRPVGPEDEQKSEELYQEERKKLNQNVSGIQ